MTEIRTPFTFIQQTDGWWFQENNRYKNINQQRRRWYPRPVWTLEDALEDWLLTMSRIEQGLVRA